MISKFDKISIEEDGKRQQRETETQKDRGRERERDVCVLSRKERYIGVIHNGIMCKRMPAYT